MAAFLLLGLEAAACDAGAPAWLARASFALSAAFLATQELEATKAGGGGHALPRLLHHVSVLLAFRVGMVFSIFWHEYSHLLADFIWHLMFAQGEPQMIWEMKRETKANWLCNVPLRAWLRACVPFTHWPEQAALPHVRLSTSCAHCARGPVHGESALLSRTSIIRYAGVLGSLVLAVLVTLTSPSADESLHLSAFELATWLVFTGACCTDLFGMLTTSDCKAPSGFSIFRCGNFGMLIVSSRNKIVDASMTLQRMAKTTAARGGQAGGLVTVLPDGSTVRSRYVPTKRADVAKGLVQWFFMLLHLSRIWSLVKALWRRVRACSNFCRQEAVVCADSSNSPSFFLGHTRFATSSGPSVKDTHPHRFSRPSRVNIWRFGVSGWVKSSENFEVFVTHNGDLDYMEELDSKVLRTHKELGVWLQAVLGTSWIPGCDSVKVAGLVELFRTQGIWKHALRLSALLSSSRPSFSEPLVDTKTINAAAAIADEVFGDFLGKCGPDALNDQSNVELLSTWIAAGLYDKVHILRNHYGTCERLAELATQAFIENDLFTAVHKILGKAHGSFGISACCSVDRELVVIASRGQAMSISFNEQHGVVLWGSEACALAVPFLNTHTRVGKSGKPGRSGNSSGFWPDVEMSLASTASGDNLEATGVQGSCTHRHDLDEDGGEVVELRVAESAECFAKNMMRWASSHNCHSGVFGCRVDAMGGFFAPFLMQRTLHLRLYKQKEQMFLTKSDFKRPDSCAIVSTQESANDDAVQTNHECSSDIVAQDLQDIPRVLVTIRKEWSYVHSHNCLTSQAFFDMLKQLIISRNAATEQGSLHDRLEIDVLITGCEASLWIGEQFASDLQALLPSLRVVAMSANKIIGVLSNSRGSAPMSGFAFSSRTMSLKKTIVFAISHSGQTFPTLHATHTLRKICGDRVFVLTGSIDSKMSAAVGQLSHNSAPWVARTWTTFAGWRPAEALTVSTVALHQTCTELLLYVARNAVCERDSMFPKASGLKLDMNDVDDMLRLNLASTMNGIPGIVGFTAEGDALESSVKEGLRKQGRKWALHVLEGPYSWCLSAAYICVTVLWGHSLFLSVAELVHDAIQKGQEGRADQILVKEVKYPMLAFDAVLYCFLPLFFSLVLRIFQGRELLARLGKRTLVIADLPYVHQLLENYVSKLFSLSYSIASLDVHGANAIDHLVHRFTHRVYRGTLIAVGRSDGRLFSQSKGESWILMAMQQCKAIMHLGCGPEIISIGHNPYTKREIFSNHTVLSTSRPPFLCETLSDVKTLRNAREAADPMSLAATVKKIDATTSSVDDTFKAFSTDNWIDDVSTPEPSSPLAMRSSPLRTALGWRKEVGAHLPIEGSNDGADGQVPCCNAGPVDSFRIKPKDIVLNVKTAIGLHYLEGLAPEQHLHMQRTLSGLLQRESSTLHFENEASHDMSRHSSHGHEMSHHSMRSLAESSMHAAGAFFRDISRHSMRQNDGNASLHDAKNRNEDMDPDKTVHSCQTFAELAEFGGPAVLDRAVDQINEGFILQLLDKTSSLELWYENRHASLERYVAFLVLFHEMAARVAAFAPLNFDTSRSQSQLRVATTAAPISACEIQKKWATDFDVPEAIPEDVASSSSDQDDLHPEDTETHPVT